MPSKTVIITGASSGLGAALALAYAAAGIRLGLVGRNETRLAASAAACRTAGAEVAFAALDVADADALGSWVGDFTRAAPSDIVIANAGTSAGPAPHAFAEGVALASRQVKTNLLGVINTIEPLLPGMIARRSGRIAVIASIAALRGLPYSPGYSASKAGARAYGEALRALVAPAGVSVTVACPGFFASPMTDRFKGSTPFLLSVSAAAARIKKAIDRGKARVNFPLPLVTGLRFMDLAPPVLGDPILRHFRFHIVPGP